MDKKILHQILKDRDKTNKMLIKINEDDSEELKERKIRFQMFLDAIFGDDKLEEDEK